jgi:PKHD-type hydroxylase
MFLEHRDFLTQAEVARLVTLSQRLKFVEGRLSNPANTSKVNLQADMGDPGYAESAQIVMAAFERSRTFRDFAFPRKIAPPLLSRYEPGMKYGAHADSAFMSVTTAQGTLRLRSDISCTVFLNDPNSYEGGELVLHIGTRPVPVKGYPGEAFVYPSTLLHEVRPVRSGARLVSITFIESRVPDERHRAALYELSEVLALEGLKMDWTNRVRMEVVIQNLLRDWSAPES